MDWIETTTLGQVVVMAARWVLVVAGCSILALWNPLELSKLEILIALVAGLAGGWVLSMLHRWSWGGMKGHKASTRFAPANKAKEAT